MALLNIGITGLVLNSNVQVGYELLMDEVIGKLSLIKSMRGAMQDYEIELPLDFFLECHLGRNVDVAAINSMDEPEVIPEDVDEED